GPRRHPPETVPPDPCDARGALGDPRGNLQADGEGRPGVQVRWTPGPGPRLPDEGPALLAASGEHHRAVRGNRRGPSNRDSRPGRNRRGGGGPGGLEYGRVRRGPGSQPPAGTEDRGRPEGWG